MWNILWKHNEIKFKSLCMAKKTIHLADDTSLLLDGSEKKNHYNEVKIPVFWDISQNLSWHKLYQSTSCLNKM